MPCLGSEKKEKVKKEKDNKEKKEVQEEKIIKEKVKKIKSKKEKDKKDKETKEEKNKEKKEKDKKKKEKKSSKSDHSSSSPHGVGSPSSGAIGKVTSASSSLSSASTATAAEAATSKVRVTFFESEKPHVVVGSPEPLANAFDAATEDLLSLPLDAQGLASGSQQQQQLLLLATSTMTSPSPIAVPPYDRQTSTDSGWDNPFRPDGDLSREADEIVELIKGGKPITPTPGSVAPPLPSVEDSTDGPPSTPPGVHEKATSVPLTNSVKPDGVAKPPSSPKGGGTGANGNAAPATTAVAPSKGPSSVEVQRGHVPPGDQCQVEHVVLKKKPKCKCCVIQ